MPKFYTKTGDCGTTSLYDASRVGKEEMIFEVLGALDELSAHMGMLCTECTEEKRTETYLRKLQWKLLDIGSDIATVKNRQRIKPITDEDIKELETQIASYENKDDKLTEFVLPGVTRKDAITHVCRTVCRRVEQRMCVLRKYWKDGLFHTGNATFVFLNRMSSFFFVLARFLSKGQETTRSDAVLEFTDWKTPGNK